MNCCLHRYDRKHLLAVLFSYIYQVTTGPFWSHPRDPGSRRCSWRMRIPTWTAGRLPSLIPSFAWSTRAPPSRWAQLYVPMLWSGCEAFLCVRWRLVRALMAPVPYGLFHSVSFSFLLKNILFIYFYYKFFFFFFAALHGMWDLINSSLTRDWTCAPFSGSTVFFFFF